MAVTRLSSFLNQHGFETEVIIIEGEPNYIDRIKSEIKPDIIGFSAAIVHMTILTSINRTIKNHDDCCRFLAGRIPPSFRNLLRKIRISMPSVSVKENRRWWNWPVTGC